MGDRISIQFKNKDEESIILFSHWMGMKLINKTKDYLNDLNLWLKNKENGISNPLSRKEPNTVMIDFIRWLTKDKKRIEGDLYLGKDKNNGDNSDNGHHKIDIT